MLHNPARINQKATPQRRRKEGNLWLSCEMKRKRRGWRKLLNRRRKGGCCKAQDSSKAKEMPILWRQRRYGEGMWVYDNGEENECPEGRGCGTQVVEDARTSKISYIIVIGNNRIFLRSSDFWVEHTCIKPYILFTESCKIKSMETSLALLYFLWFAT
jgi:hypothetical protein